MIAIRYADALYRIGPGSPRMTGKRYSRTADITGLAAFAVIGLRARRIVPPASRGAAGVRDAVALERVSPDQGMPFDGVAVLPCGRQLGLFACRINRTLGNGASPRSEV